MSVLTLAGQCKVAFKATHAGWAKCPPYGALALGLLVSPAAALDVPSGQPIALHEVLTDTVGTESWLRFRFVAPDLIRNGDYEKTAADMMHLCETTALPYIAQYDLQGAVIVISLSDRVTAFGATNPDAVQFFEAFRSENNTCIWEDM